MIKALYDYESTNKNGDELAFHKGDFFHVIGREDDTEWYEACNPLSQAVGLVPVAFFEVIGKQQRQSGHSQTSNPGHDSGFSEKGLSAASLPDPPVTASPVKAMSGHVRGMSAARGNAMVYGIVLYDFAAERADELEAKQGEAIIIVAQSNPEWFVAKPIGRLGGPGLIPVSFVSIKDTVTGKAVTDPLAAVRAAGVPRVEEWKKTAAEYKNNSISLGTINTPQIGGAQQPANPQQMTQDMERMRYVDSVVKRTDADCNSLQNHRPNPNQAQNPQNPNQRQKPGQQRPQPPLPSTNNQPPATLLAPIKASVPRYCFDNDMYWYIIEAQMSDGRWWELSRYYADFYDFQIALLKKYPEEAGMRDQKRSLPFMPGPVAHVTDAISNGRRQNLDEYIKKIVEQPAYIREDALVKKLFAPKPGQDYEIDPSALEDDYRLSGHSLAQTQSRQSSGAGSVQQSQTFPRPMHQPRPSQNAIPMPPPLHTQASNLTTNSTGSAPNPQSSNNNLLPGGQPLAPALRVKLMFQDDTLAIRVPEDIQYDAFSAKVRDRLRIVDGVELAMAYLDDERGTTAKLLDDESLARAKAQRNIRVKVEYADS